MGRYDEPSQGTSVTPGLADSHRLGQSVLATKKLWPKYQGPKTESRSSYFLSILASVIDLWSLKFGIWTFILNCNLRLISNPKSWWPKFKDIWPKTKSLFIYKTHFWNHALKTRFLFSKKRVFLQTTLLRNTLKNTLLLNKKRVLKAWFQKCVL